MRRFAWVLAGHEAGELDLLRLLSTSFGAGREIDAPTLERMAAVTEHFVFESELPSGETLSSWMIRV